MIVPVSVPVVDRDNDAVACLLYPCPYLPDQRRYRRFCCAAAAAAAACQN